MGLFDFLLKKGDSQFVPEKEFDQNSDMQVHLAPIAMNNLRMLDIDDDSELKVEFFFYTNTLEKAKTLSIELEKLSYELYHYGECGFKKGLYSITGCTDKMKMSDNIVAKWAQDMCELGYIFDCEFDGWGTTPDQ